MRTVPSTSSASGLSGYWFVFQEDGHTFAHWAAPLTGKEEVYLDGRLVSESRKFSLKSSHPIQTSQASYSSSLRSISVGSAAVQCTLSRGNVPLARAVAKYENNVPRAMRLATITIVALVVYAQYKLSLPPLATAGALVVVGGAAMALAYKRGRYVIGAVALEPEAEA